MKKFNLAKGLIIGLLTLALCFTCFGVVKASAAKGDKHKITFVASADSTVTYEVEYTEGEVGDDAVDPDPKNIAMEDIIAGLNKKDGVIYVKGTGSISGGDACLNISDTGVILLPAAKTDYTLTVPVKATAVTFNVTVKDLTKTGSAAEVQYSYKADTTFQKKGASLTVASILENLKNGETPLEDPTAWLYYSHTENAEKFTMTAEKVTLAADLTTDLTINAVVVNSKLVQKFTYGDYTAEFEVDNKKGTNQILFTDIVDKLEKPGEEEGETISFVSENGDSVILAEGFAGAATTKGKYTTWYYPVNVAGTQNAALAATPIVAKKIVPMFEEAGYEPATDSIKFVSPVDLDLYWINCKSTKGVQVKGEKLSTLSLAENKVTGDDNYGKYEGYIPLNDKDAGVKVAESKATYIYASYKAPAEDKAKYTANYIVDATPYKKIAVTFRYAQAEAATKENEAPLEVGAIATVTTIGTDKKTTVYSGEGTEAKEYKDALDEIIDDLQYSEDGATWYDIMGNEIGTDKVNHDLNLNKLYEIVSGGSKVTLYFRIVGAEAVEAKEAVGTEGEEGYKEAVAAKNAYRATKPVKVAVANAKAAKAVKVDVTKSTIALKNGYDFAMTAKDSDTPAIEGAYTILPFNKGGKAKELVWDEDSAKFIEGDDTEIWPTCDYVPAAKVTENAKAFTNIKVKTYSIEDIAKRCEQSPGGSGNLYIWIRKSATAKKPAELWTLVTVTQIAEAPVATADKTTGYYAVQELDDKKGVIKGIEVTNAKSDKNEGSFEYLIVDAKDIKAVENSNPVAYYADIDFTSAKWTALNDKGLTVGKSKSKYSNKVGVKASAHTLAAGSVVLIRRAGIKDGNILASNYTITMIVKEDVSYKDAEGKDQKKALFVWKAYSVATE